MQFPGARRDPNPRDPNPARRSEDTPRAAVERALLPGTGIEGATGMDATNEERPVVWASRRSEDTSRAAVERALLPRTGIERATGMDATNEERRLVWASRRRETRREGSVAPYWHREGNRNGRY